MSDFKKRDIAEVIMELGVDLEEHPSPTGAYWAGLCPFHDDHNPSFIVYDNVQWCQCRTCWPEGGDVIAFVMKYKDIGFLQAKKIAAEDISELDACKAKMRKVLSVVGNAENTIDLLQLSRRLLYVRSSVDAVTYARIYSAVVAGIQNGDVAGANITLSRYEEAV